MNSGMGRSWASRAGTAVAGLVTAKKRALMSLLWLGLASLLGAAREFVATNINFQIDFLSNSRERNYAHSVFREWAQGWDLADAQRAKWLAAGAFMVSMAALTAAMARTRFGDHRYIAPILLGFAALGACAGICYWTNPALLRPVAIAILHALQYPVPVLLVWVLSWLRAR
jgi:hypothetical protein